MQNEIDKAYPLDNPKKSKKYKFVTKNKLAGMKSQLFKPITFVNSRYTATLNTINDIKFGKRTDNGFIPNMYRENLVSNVLSIWLLLGISPSEIKILNTVPSSAKNIVETSSCVIGT